MGSNSKSTKNQNKNRNKTNNDNDNNNKNEGKPCTSKQKVIIDDPRFASVHSDPRFQTVPKRESKVPIDSRFDRMFTDKKFSGSSAPVDKHGKPTKRKPDSTLRKYYDVDDDDDDKDKNVKKKNKKKENVRVVKEKEEEGEESETESIDDELDVLEPMEESEEEEEEEEDVNSMTSESSSDDDEDEDNDVVYEDYDVPEAEVENVPLTEESTKRLAVVNMDWRHVRAVDLYVGLSSFLPKGGDIVSVSVYPSEFGLQQMKEEEVRGPVGLFDDKNDNNGDDDTDGDDEIDEEKVRAYEKSRLRYYYAVVECDSVGTADHLYKYCDGLEFERSSNVFDLRFIPDSMEFKLPPRDVATEAPAAYEGLDFHTKALQHSSVPISWDEDEPQRVKILKRKFNADQLAEKDLEDFLASSDDSETDEDKPEKKVDKYRALLEAGDGSEEEHDDEGKEMEITFDPDLENASKNILERKNREAESVFEANRRKARERNKACKNKSGLSSEDNSGSDADEMEDSDDFFAEEAPAKKGKKKGRRGKEESLIQDKDQEGGASVAELELLLADDKGTDNDLKGYNLKPKKKVKGKKGKEVLDETKIPTADRLNEDPRFSALFTSPDFSLDPTDPQFKRSATYARQVVQKQHRGDRRHAVEEELQDQPTTKLLSGDSLRKNDDSTNGNSDKYELSSLVRSIKTKSKQIQVPSNSNMNNK